ncbi:Aste57867_362 [Aphanomyces stellatus]|uniref:Aste57867_362 protein n=1 Tax=Aphanomyces stellatus TaxID=120398 RepID=A0A485K7L7_9STRA|nr:hypothetical protein As57867_000361 [Aphanomyces stellatus]VFT77588.1 Aste57867_362 [Aphanomyces stellatus]
MAEELSKTDRRRAAKAKKKAAAATEKMRRQDKREEMKQRRRDAKMAPKQGANENGCWICGGDHRKQDCTEGNSNKSCFHCRKKGHDINSCPQRGAAVNDMCFNCGETGHSLWKCPKPKVGDGTSFAQCFVCQGTGHLSSKCPLSEKGIYPKGGCCKVCQSKMHLAKDCPHKDGPQNTKKTFNDDDEEDDGGDVDDSGVPANHGGDELGDNDIIEGDEEAPKPKKSQYKKKVVKF